MSPSRGYPPASLAWFVWSLGAALYLIAFYQRVAPAVLTQELQREFALTGAALGNLSAFYFYGYVAMQIPTGLIADQWGLKSVQDPRFFADDRLHMNPLGHHEVARMVLRALNVPNDLQEMAADPFPERTWREARSEDLVWARTHLVPWVLRRLRHQSSGDTIAAKRPEPTPVVLPHEE